VAPGLPGPSPPCSLQSLPHTPRPSPNPQQWHQTWRGWCCLMRRGGDATPRDGPRAEWSAVSHAPRSQPTPDSQVRAPLPQLGHHRGTTPSRPEHRALRKVPASLISIRECPLSLWTQVGPPPVPWAPETAQVRAGAQAACDLHKRAVSFLAGVLGSQSLLYEVCVPDPRRRLGEASCIRPWAVAAPEVTPRSPDQRQHPPKATQPDTGFVPLVGHGSLPPELCLPKNAPIPTDPGASEHLTARAWRSVHTQDAGRASRPVTATVLSLHRNPFPALPSERCSGGCKATLHRAARAREAAGSAGTRTLGPRREVFQTLDAWACGRNSSPDAIYSLGTSRMKKAGGRPRGAEGRGAGRGRR